MKIKNKIGRPTTYKEEYCEKAIEILRNGDSKYQLALQLDVCFDTLQEWEKVHPEFSFAIKKGLTFSRAWWEKQGKDNLKNKDFNVGNYHLQMKNRFGWHDPKAQYRLVNLEGFEGSPQERIKVINKALRRKEISIDQHSVLMNTIVEEINITEVKEIQKKIIELQEKLDL